MCFCLFEKYHFDVVNLLEAAHVQVDVDDGGTVCKGDPRYVRSVWEKTSIEREFSRIFWGE